MMNTHQWQSTQERVDELTGKISVKKRDNESMFKKQQEAIERNEEQISNLRVIVKEARQKLAIMMNKDFHVIEEALKGNRFTQLQCKRYDVDTAKKELNEDVCVEHKRLNHYIHQKECRMRRLEDLRLRLRDFNLLQETNFEKEDHKRLRLLMTKLDKMVTKRNTAKYIQSTYNKTLNKLNRDALTMHQHLDQFEVEVVNNQTELADFKKIHQSAKTGQESARSNRLSMEQIVFHNKQIRDKTLSETRKRAKECSQMPDISTNRAPADILNVGQNKVKKQTMDRPSDILTGLTSVIQVFGNVTNTVTAADIPKAYMRQNENFQAMQEQAKNLEAELNKRKQIASDYENKLNEIKYQQKENTAELDQKIAQLRENNTKLDHEAEKNIEQMESESFILHRVMDGINSLTEKLTPAQINGLSATPSTTSRSLADNNLKEQVAEINEKLKHMVALLSDADISTVVGEEPKTQEEMEDHIDELCISTAAKQRNGARVTINYDDDERVRGENILVDDINVNEHYVTREDIKKPKLKNKKR